MNVRLSHHYAGGTDGALQVHGSLLNVVLRD
jgi:hypothetical protein